MLLEQVSSWPHMPQLALLPHALETLPHCAPAGQLTSGHAQRLLPLQTSSLPQLPQLVTVRGCIQLSMPATCPQVLPCRVQKSASLSGIQMVQVLSALHCPIAQVPQSSVRIMPQLS